MSRFTILLGGELTPTPRLASQIAGSRVIAADAGMRHAIALGLTPELWVGDFDSEPDGLPENLMAVARRPFPHDKAKTDGELATDEALTLGATELILVGAFGGPRLDHAFLHLTLAMRLMEAGHSVLLSSGAQEGVPIRPVGLDTPPPLKGEVHSEISAPPDRMAQMSPPPSSFRGGGISNAFDYPDNTVFSVIAFNDLEGLTVTGARWPLDDFSMRFGSSRTISNEVQGDLRVTLKSGRAMLVAHPFPISGF